MSVLMINLALACGAFIAIHLLVSGTSLRDAITARTGDGAYMGLFSLASVAILAWMIWAYALTRGVADNPVFWTVSFTTRNAQVVFTFLAFLLIVPGLLTANPTSVRQEGALDKDNAVQGMLRITRHPFLWGVAIWAAGHLMVNGDLASLILFGSMLALAVFGTISIDAKRRRALGDKWDAFAGQTSNVPFGAIISGQQSLRLNEVGWRILPAIVIWGVIAYFHANMFGVAALP